VSNNDAKLGYFKQEAWILQPGKFCQNYLSWNSRLIIVKMYYREVTAAFMIATKNKKGDNR